LQLYASPMKKIAGLLSMMRLPNCIMIGFAVIVGEAIASQTVPAQVALYGFMTGFFLLSSSMVLNDYFDREIDAINEPKRPLPAGMVKPGEAVSFAILLAALGFLYSAYSGVWTLLIAAASMVIMIAYNARVKRHGLMGNALVSINVAIPFIYGGLAVGSLSWPLGIFALLAFLSSLGREIVKGIVDVAGDSARGVRSLAATLGNAKAAKAGAVLFCTAVGLSVIPVILGLVSYYYIPLVAICDIGFLLTAYSVLTSPTPRNAKRSKNYILIWMTFGLLAFVIGTL
jgi:geranylgeranylglycerol-phosphate geranylgeranyltransferase